MPFSITEWALFASATCANHVLTIFRGLHAVKQVTATTWVICVISAGLAVKRHLRAAKYGHDSRPHYVLVRADTWLDWTAGSGSETSLRI